MSGKQRTILIGFFAITMAACGAAGSVQPQPAAQPVPPTPDLERGLKSVLVAQDIDGRTVGQRPDMQATAVVVFASWCGPCRHELAVLGELVQEEPRLRVIGVNAYEEYEDRSSEDQLRAFLATAAPWLQVVRASESLLDALGHPTKIPTMFLFDGQGKLVQAYLRADRIPPDKAELQARLREILASQAPGPAASLQGIR